MIWLLFALMLGTMLLVIFCPPLASWIPHYFLG